MCVVSCDEGRDSIVKIRMEDYDTVRRTDAITLTNKNPCCRMPEEYDLRMIQCDQCKRSGGMVYGGDRFRYDTPIVVPSTPVSRIFTSRRR